jgi:hypothetical protein
MKRIIGYKFLRADGSSISGEHGRIIYTRRWQKIPGNGAYVGSTWEGLCVGGMGAIIAEVECQRPTGAWASDGVACYGRVRVLRWLAPPTAPALAEYGRVRAPAWAEYERDRTTASAWAEYERATASAWAEYGRATARAFRRMMRGCNPAKPQDQPSTNKSAKKGGKP